MADSFWVIQAIFLLGFFHGIRGDHVIDVLNSREAEDIYDRPSWISFKLGLMHLGYALCFILPVWLLRIEIPGLLHLSSQPALGSIFLTLGLYSLYEFFWVPPKQLHQHDHHHEHEHGHLHHQKPDEVEHDEHDKPDSAGRGGHVSHVHQDIDRPEPVAIEHPVALEHKHPHDHQHEHLHFHDPDAERTHCHQHHPGMIKRLGTLHNLLSLLAVSMAALIFPLPGILFSLAVFLIGLFMAIYLLCIVYRGMGINLMGRIDHLATFLLGVIAGLTGFLLLMP